MSTEHTLIHTRCVFGHLPTRGEIRSVSVWPLTHQRRNLCGHLLTGSELCLFGHFTYSPERNSVCLATYSLKEKIYLFGCVITYRRRNTHSAFVWPLSHQCLFGHFLTSVWPLTHQGLFGHLLTSVFGHLFTSVWSLTHQCLVTYTSESVWPLTHQRRKGAVLWDVEHTLIYTQRLVEVLGVVYRHLCHQKQSGFVVCMELF